MSKRRSSMHAACRLLLLAVAAAWACVDGDPAAVQAPLTLSLVPNASADLTAQSISRIRVRVVTVGGTEVAGPETFSVSPDASEWNVEVEVDLRDVGEEQVILTVELISVTGGVERVEWSGRIGPLRLTAGSSSPLTVPVYPGPLDNLDVTGVSIDPPSRSVLLEGESVQLQGTLEGGGSGARIVWASLDPQIATVGEDGMVVTHLPGSTRIVAQAGPRSAEVSLQVVAKLAQVVLNPSTVEVEAPGDVAQFVAEAQDPRGAAIPASAVSLSWAVANSSIATHEGGGRFRTLSKGSTGIGVTAVSTVSEVSQPPVSTSGTLVVRQGVATITVSPSSLSFDRLGRTASVSAVAKDANGAVVSDAVFQWRSSDTGVATVNSSGIVTSAGNGTAQVTASADNATGTVEVVVQQSVSSVTVTPSSASVEVGVTVQFQAQAKDPGGAAITGRTFTWSSSNGAVATVDAEGLATGVANGTAQIRATLGGVTGSASLSVGSSVTPGEYLAIQGGSTIRIIQPDGTAVRNTGEAGLHPEWFPDGNSIAFTPSSGGGIAIMPAFASPPAGAALVTRLGNTSVQYYGSSISGNGLKIAAWRSYGSESTESIAIIDVSTGAETRASSLFPVFDPDWHFDNEHLAVSYEGWRILILHPGQEDHPFQTFPPSGYSDRFPEFSPDGNRIAFVRTADNGSGAMLMILDTNLFTPTNERTIATDAYHRSSFGQGLAWSPDGQWVAYTCGGVAGDICKVRVDGTGHTNVTNTSGTGEYAPSWVEVGSGAPPGGQGSARRDR